MVSTPSEAATIMNTSAKSLFLIGFLGLAGCSASSESPVPNDLIDLEAPGEGVAFDEENPGADIDATGKADIPPTYQVPTDLPELERPEIIVSLAGLTVHLFDRATRFSQVYPTGVGLKNSAGLSITPTGFFKTSANTSDTWYYTARRYKPDYFGGFPFLRLNVLNSKGQETYGMHGPITYRCPNGGSSCSMLQREWFLQRGFVSQGCMRMDIDDIVDLFWIVKNHRSTPVSIQAELELDAHGLPVDIDNVPALWEVGQAIQYGSCGKRPDPYSSDQRWPSRRCD
jgi:hypothetical protein